jgi:hypothetical protein
MKFYVRRSKALEIDGPFTIEEINQLLREKRFTLKSLAIADTGQGLQAAHRTPPERWTKIADLPGYEPDPDAERNCLGFALVILIILGVVAVLGLIKLSDILRRIH